MLWHFCVVSDVFVGFDLSQLEIVEPFGNALARDDSSGLAGFDPYGLVMHGEAGEAGCNVDLQP